MFVAIILAAGIGSRLNKITENIPKCMVEVNNIKIIDNQINNILSSGIKKIIIVGGYKYDMLSNYLYKKYPNNNIIIINNEQYEITNNMYSFFLTKKITKFKNIILMNGDVFFDKKILQNLIKNKNKNLICVDKENFNDENMKVVVKNDKIVKISKDIDKNEWNGTSIDLYKFSILTKSKLYKIIDKYLKNNQKKLWTEIAINDLFKHKRIKPMYINEKWFEIDNENDLESAGYYFKND